MAANAGSALSDAPALPKRPRLPLLLAAMGATVFLAVAQALVLIVRNQSFIDRAAAVGFARLALIVALGTMLGLLPLALLLRRYHPAQRAGDRLRASWAVCFGLAAAVAAWAIGDLLAAQWLSPALSGWLALAVALPIALTASYLQPPRRWLLTWCWLSVALTVASLLPWPGPGESSSSDQPAKASRSERSRAPGGAGPDRRPDVVLVSIDTLRADHLGAYGRAPSITPEMDRIAAEGVVFARTVSASPWTTPSVASLLTGLPVVRHDAGRPLAAGPTFERSPLGASFTTLAERFAAAGYRTRAVVANGFLSPGSGMAQGFDEFVNPSFGYSFAGILRDLPLTRLILAFVPPERWGDPRAAGVTDRALAWLAEKDAAPLFLWAHYIDPHVPYQRDPARLDPADEMDMMRQTPPPLLPDGTVVGEVFGSSELVRSGMLWLGPRDRERLASYYAGEVTYTDRHVGRLFAALRRRSVGRPLVVALTADHGEEFWDHGHFEHGHDYYCEVTRVPLIFWGPGVVPAGRRVETLAGIVDVGATLLDWSGLPLPEGKYAGTGRSLVAALAAPIAADPSPVAYTAGGNLYGLPSALLEEGAWSYILRANDIEELYDVTHDPRERYNVAVLHPELTARFRQRLRPQLLALLHTGQGNAARELSPEELQALRALGYAR